MVPCLPPKPISLTNRKVPKNLSKGSLSRSPVAMEMDIPASNISGGDESFLQYGKYSLGSDYGSKTRPKINTLDNSWSAATKRRGAYDLIQVPSNFE